MKRFALNLSFAAVLTMVAVIAAPAQTMTVSVPFPFYAHGAERPAGTYYVTGGASRSSYFRLDLKSGGTTFLPPPVATNVPASARASGKGFMAFDCVENNCELRSFWMPGSYAAWEFPAKRSKREGHGLSVVRVVSENAR